MFRKSSPNYHGKKMVVYRSKAASTMPPNSEEGLCSANTIGQPAGKSAFEPPIPGRVKIHHNQSTSYKT